MATPAHTLDLDRPLTELARVDYVHLFEHETVSQSIERIRQATPGDRIAYFYITNRRDQLVGVVPARRLLIAHPDTRVSEVMIGSVVSVPEHETLRTALEVLASRRLLAVPIVDEHNHLNGVIDMEHYTQEAVDLERREASETLFQLLGVHIEQERAGLWTQFRSRFPWLLVSVASGLAAALVTGLFEGVLKRTVALAFFFPVVMGLAESISMIAATIGLQRLHHQGIGVGRELRIGPVLGIAGGLLVATAAAVFIGSWKLAGVLWAAVAIGATVGTGVGLWLPGLVYRWKLDPKVAAGPAVLAMTDVATLTAYLGLAGMVLG